MIVLSLSMLFLCSDMDSQCLNELPSSKPSRPHDVRRLAYERIEKIRSHAQTADALHWEGVYKDLRKTLAVSRHLGYVFVREDSFGTEPEIGTVFVEDGDRLFIRLDRSGLRPTSQSELIGIEWGTRLYLVPPDDIVEFCNGVNAFGNSELLYWLREGDVAKDISGKPAVPDEFKKYLLDEPIRGEVTRVHPQTSRRTVVGRNVPVKGILLEVSIGAKSGLHQGMRLYAQIPRLHECYVLRVFDESSELILDLAFDNEARNLIQPGIAVHSSFRDAFLTP